MERMVCNYKMNLEKIEVEIAGIKSMVKNRRDSGNFPSKRLADLIEKREILLVAIEIFSDIIDRSFECKGEVA